MEQKEPELNFDFINQQPEVVVKKRLSTKVLVLIVLITLLMLLTIIGVIAKSKKMPATSNTDSPTSSHARLIQAMAMSDEEYLAQLVPLLSPERGINLAVVESSVLRLRESVDFKSCVQQPDIKGQSVDESAVYVCQLKNGKKINLEIIGDDKIEALRVVPGS